MIESDCLADFLQMIRLIVSDHHIRDVNDVFLVVEKLIKADFEEWAYEW